MIRRTQHNISYANRNKLDALDSILIESKRVINLFIDSLWTGSATNQKFISTKVDTWLSARMQQCLGKQALEIVKSQNKRKKKTKPIFKSDVINFDGRFIDVSQDDNSFDLWFRLSSIGNKISINLPSKKHKHFNKFAGWTNKNSVRLRKDGNKYYIDLFHEKTTEPNNKPETIAFDCGYKKLLSDSNNQHYGVDLKLVYDRLANKKRGSRKYKKLVVYKNNMINQVLNNLPLDDVGHVVVEDLKQVKYKSKLGSKFNNKLQYWSYKRVLDKFGSLSEVKGFKLTKVNPAYTSQTCSCCGVIDKKSRQGEAYHCSTCGVELDADYNGARNILHRGTYSSSNFKTIS